VPIANISEVWIEQTYTLSVIHVSVNDCDVNYLKEQLIEKWQHFDQSIIDRAVNRSSVDSGWIAASLKMENTLNLNGLADEITAKCVV